MNRAEIPTDPEKEKFLVSALPPETVVNASVDIGIKHHGDNLNHGLAQVQLEKLGGALKDVAQRKYVIRWKGIRTPRGAHVGNHIIGFAKNGTLFDEQSQPIGTYTRTKDGGGEAEEENEMIVSVLEKPL